MVCLGWPVVGGFPATPDYLGAEEAIGYAITGSNGGSWFGRGRSGFLFNAKREPASFAGFIGKFGAADCPDPTRS